jgi:hypothetical protein
MRKRATIGGSSSKPASESRTFVSDERASLWQLDFAEVTGHNLESRGRKEVNRLLDADWRLLLAYTLRYEEMGLLTLKG